jgi:hypothetical protein
MAAALESLFALYSPLWLQNSNGTGSDIFTAVVKHFASQTTYELTLNGSIRSILSKAQNTLFNHVHKKHPNSFKPGFFASCDYFIEIILDPRANPTRALKGLFAVPENQEYICSAQHESPREPNTRSFSMVHISENLFNCNNLDSSGVAKFFKLWSTSCIYRLTGLSCRTCPRLDETTLTENLNLTLPKGNCRHTFTFYWIMSPYSQISLREMNLVMNAIFH